MRKTLKQLGRNLINIPGWHTKRKIVVFESDDWGSIRMPSKTISQKLTSFGIDNSNYMNRFDNLESEEDIIALYETLSQFKDRRNNPPIITANFIMANPNFDRIKETNFNEYFYETFDETYKRYPNHQNCFSLLNEGISKRLIHPQYHGREHLNVSRWLTELKNGNKEMLFAFEHEVFGIELSNYFNRRSNLMAALDFEDEESKLKIEEILKDGIALFESKFKFKPSSFIAPCHVWGRDAEKILHNIGINTIQGIPVQLEPIIGQNKFKRVFHYTGQQNKFKQTYLIRNCFFELSSSDKFPWVKECLSRIELSFKWNKPAIISIHRLNFVGSLVENNRTNNLLQLNILLEQILKKWPEVEFMSSDQLSKIIKPLGNFENNN